MAHFELENGDFAAYLVGPWKRNLEWRHFGGIFSHLRTTNNTVVIEEKKQAAVQPNTKFLTWSFGTSFEKKDLVASYSVQFLSKDHMNRTLMEWSFEGTICHGFFDPMTNVAIFHFALPQSLVTITYRIIDINSTFVFNLKIVSNTL